MLSRLGVLTEADRPALILLCDVYGEWLDLRDVVRKRGHTYDLPTKNGGVMQMPRLEVAMASDCWRRVNLMLQQFGMTPSSKAKVSGAPAEDVDPLDELLGKRAQ
jgi:P27 family predicted phage terminase small subunit